MGWMDAFKDFGKIFAPPRRRRVRRIVVVRRKRSQPTADQRWIQRAIKKPGALREYLRRNFGDAAFTKDGKIKVTFVKQLLKEGNIRPITRRRIQLYLNLRKLRARKLR